jgi:hypothetical protein
VGNFGKLWILRAGTLEAADSEGKAIHISEASEPIRVSTRLTR